jgi:hypothetical protein
MVNEGLWKRRSLGLDGEKCCLRYGKRGFKVPEVREEDAVRSLVFDPGDVTDFYRCS